MSARARWWLPILCLLLVAAAPAPAAPAPAAIVRLAPGARVRVVLQYPACAVRLSGEGPLPVGLVGLDAPQVGAALGSVAIVSLTPDLLVVERAFNGCPVDYVTLVARDGMVVVLAGPRGATSGPGDPTGIPLRALPIEDIHRIEAGWTVAADALQATLRSLRTR
jgi:hypothetical protein